MCSRYQPPHVQLADWDEIAGSLPPTFEFKPECFPGYDAPVILNDVSRAPVRACFGMLPHWAKDEKLARQTYNARTETVAEKPSFRNAWKKRQLCLVPAQAFMEPNYETGKPVWWRIHRADAKPFALAGIWESKRGEDDRPRRSFSMLTIPGAGHPIMDRMHAPGDEKRSVVVVPAEDYGRWLEAKDEDEIRSMLHLFDAGQFTAEQLPKTERNVKKA